MTDERQITKIQNKDPFKNGLNLMEKLQHRDVLRLDFMVSRSL